MEGRGGQEKRGRETTEREGERGNSVCSAEILGIRLIIAAWYGHATRLCDVWEIQQITRSNRHSIRTQAHLGTAAYWRSRDFFYRGPKFRGSLDNSIFFAAYPCSRAVFTGTCTELQARNHSSQNVIGRRTNEVKSYMQRDCQHVVTVDQAVFDRGGGLTFSSRVGGAL